MFSFGRSRLPLSAFEKLMSERIQRLERLVAVDRAPKNRCGNCCFFERLPDHEYFGRCGYGWLGKLRRKFGPTKDDLRSCRRWAPDMSRL